MHRKMVWRRWGGAATWLALGLTSSCVQVASTEPSPQGAGGPPSAGAATGSGGAGGSAGGASGTAGLTIDVGNAGTGQAGGACLSTAPLADDDRDGFTVQAGDCSDCDPAVNPGAYDFPGNAVDEDCSGTPDDEAQSCDGGLPITGDDAMDAARAIGLCRVQQGQSWGVVAARWVYPNGESTSRLAPGAEFPDDAGCVEVGLPTNPDSRGVLPSFGPNVSPREGAALVALSTGVARAGTNLPAEPAEGSSPGGAAMCTENVAPPGFPKDSLACPEAKTAENVQARDAIALELEIKTPTNARALAFDFDFYTYEWPQYVCSEFNDFFVALLKSSHASTPADENISFDKLGNPVSVNNGFVEVCNPATGSLRPGGKLFECALGTSELVGTGFDKEDGAVISDDLIDIPALSSHAATGWLTTTAAIVPGETIRLRFAVWDMFDQALDSTVLLDHFKWTLIEPTTPVTERPPNVK